MHRAGRLFALSLVLVACDLSAQTASIEGALYDSVRGSVLRGAVVVIEGTPNAVRSDSAGRFRLDSLAAGSYVIAVESEALDSLGLAVPPAKISVREGERKELTLATPSAATLLSSVCAGADLAEEEGVLSGVVRDARTRTPVAGAAVDLHWDVWTMQATHLEKRRTGQIVRTGLDGSFLACGVPSGALVALTARAGDRTSGEAEVRMTESRITRRDVGVGGAGESSVRGRVIFPSGGPAPGARVSVAGDSGAASSDERGTFLIGRAPSGSQTLVVRHLGFAETRFGVDLASGANDDVMVRLLPIPKPLAPVTTYARAGSPEADRAGFETRKKRGNGHFVDRARIAQAGSVQVPELLRGVSGFEVHFSTFGSAALWVRPSYLKQVCTPIYYLDGLQVAEEHTGRSTDVESLEAYAPGLAPPRYGGATATCAVVLIWTRRAPSETPAERSAPESAAAPP